MRYFFTAGKRTPVHHNNCDYTDANYNIQVFRSWSQLPSINASEIVNVCRNSDPIRIVIISRHYMNDAIVLYMNIVYCEATVAFRINVSDFREFFLMTVWEDESKIGWLKEGF